MQRLPEYMRAMLSSRNPSDQWVKTVYDPGYTLPIKPALINAAVRQHGAMIVFNMTQAQATSLRSSASRYGLAVNVCDPKTPYGWRKIGFHLERNDPLYDLVVTVKR